MKRIAETALAAAALIVLSPVLLGVALVVRLSMGSPVLFRQERAGLHGESFWIYKFRTMRDGTGPDEERLTAVGSFLRSTSLDELPELLNVVRGEMSFVGPRPLPVKYLPRYNERQHRRHLVRPGITGLAQVNGRNLVDWDERFELDVTYVEEASLRLDASILARTVTQVIKRDGISADGMATMREFTGSAATE